MNRFSVSILLFFIVLLSVKAQKIVPTPDDIYTEATEYMYSGDYREALANLQSLQEKGYQSANLNYLTGECYLNIRGLKTRAIAYLKEASVKISADYKGVTYDEDKAPVKCLLFLGIAYRLNYDFENAMASFNRYLQFSGDSEKENRKLAEYHMERCNYARELMAAPAKFTTDTLGDQVNTYVSNFNPLVTPDEKKLYYVNELKFYDAIMQSENLNETWQAPVNLTPEIKSDGDHYITGISADGSNILLTAYDPYNSGEIYTSSLQGTQWNEIKKLNNRINTVFNETHASLSGDGKVLYFTSDRKGGYGGLDIYKSDLGDHGEWKSPVNLGPLINTPYNEESPFVTPDGRKLFFSSQGHYNMGGYDVFYSVSDSAGNWLPPVNIGFPLNTTDDDLFFYPVDTGEIAYQSRFSEQTAQQDIVRYTVVDFGRPARFIINGKMDLRAEPDYRANSISVTFVDRKANDTIASRQLNDDGSFRQKLAAGDYTIDFSDGTRSLLKKELNIPAWFPHNNLVIHENLVVPVSVASDTLVIRDIRFAFNSSQLETKYHNFLDSVISLMDKYPEMTIELNGYSDALGDEAYNIRLSEQRAESVRLYLQKLPEYAARIKVAAFGEKNPVAANRRSNGHDNPAGRSYNRRVEMIIQPIPSTLIPFRVNDIPGELRME